MREAFPDLHDMRRVWPLIYSNLLKDTYTDIQWYCIAPPVLPYARYFINRQYTYSNERKERLFIRTWTHTNRLVLCSGLLPNLLIYCSSLVPQEMENNGNVVQLQKKTAFFDGVSSGFFPVPLSTIASGRCPVLINLKGWRDAIMIVANRFSHIN